MSMDKRPQTIFDAFHRKLNQFLGEPVAPNIQPESSRQTPQIKLREPRDPLPESAVTTTRKVDIKGHIVIDGEQVGTPLPVSSSEETQMFPDQSEQRMPTTQWLENELSSMVDRSTLAISSGERMQVVTIDPKHELIQTWGQSVNNIQTCILASMQMLMGHAGIINNWQNSFDFVRQKMEIISVAKHINPSMVDTANTGSLVIQPAQRDNYLMLFKSLDEITEGFHSPSGTGTMDFVGGRSWGEDELRKFRSNMPEEFISDVRGDAFIGKVAMIARMADSFLNNRGEVFSTDLHASNEDGGDSGHNIVIGGMRTTKDDEFNSVEFWVVDPLDKVRGDGYWAKPEAFLNSTCLFIATSPSERPRWISSEL